MTGEGLPLAKTADGYDTCPECGHHTSACIAGRCTVILPVFDGDDFSLRYCDCDCHKALHGVSLTGKIFGTGTS